MREMTAWEFVGGRERTNYESMVRKFEGYNILVGKLRGNMILGPHKDPRKLFPCGVPVTSRLQEISVPTTGAEFHP